jgi:hypothetical protein
MSITSSSPFSQIRLRVRAQIAIARERREHDSAMTDPRIRDEHFAARGRAVSAGDGDCPFCA